MDQISYILTLHQQLGLRVRLTKFYLTPSQTVVLHLDTLLSLTESKDSKILIYAGTRFAIPDVLVGLLSFASHRGKVETEIHHQLFEPGLPFSCKISLFGV